MCPIGGGAAVNLEHLATTLLCLDAAHTWVLGKEVNFTAKVMKKTENKKYALFFHTRFLYEFSSFTPAHEFAKKKK